MWLLLGTNRKIYMESSMLPSHLGLNHLEISKQKELGIRRRIVHSKQMFTSLCVSLNISPSPSCTTIYLLLSSIASRCTGVLFR